MAAGTIPVWSSNRGTAMMVRVALNQAGRTPAFVESFDELVRMAREPGVTCVIVSDDDLALAGVTPNAVVNGLSPNLGIVLLASGNPAAELQGTAARVVRIPFSAAELRHAVDAGDRLPRSPGLQTGQQAPAGITELVKAEIDRIVREKAEAMVAEAVMKIVPELAEVMIKAELQRLLSEEADKAVSEDPPPDED